MPFVGELISSSEDWLDGGLARLKYNIDNCPECGRNHKKDDVVVWNKSVI